jgi:hypothetical protein
MRRMLTLASIGVVVVALFGASLLVERLLGRSRQEFQKPGWFFVFFGLFVPAGVLVYLCVDVGNPLLYAAYGLAGGISALVAQCFFGVKLPGRVSHGE